MYKPEFGQVLTKKSNPALRELGICLAAFKNEANAAIGFYVP